MDHSQSPQPITPDGPVPDAQAPAEASADQSILVWEAKEFAEYDRDKRWYLVVIAVGALLAVGSLVSGILSGSLHDILSGFLVGLVFTLVTYIVIKHADDKPRQMVYSITKLGIHIGETFHPYNELKLFWMIYKPPVKTLNIQTVNRFRPLIKIDLADIDPLAIRSTLREYLPEDTKREEDLLDKLSRFIRL